MKKISLQRYEARARIAQALANPTRLLILDALSRCDLCVGELVDLAGLDQSTVSKHLAILKNVGLVEDRKDGTMSYYHLQCKCLGGFSDCIESVLQHNAKVHLSVLAK